MSFRGKLTERFADVPKMRPDLVKIGIIKDGFVYGSLVVDGKRCFICISAFVGNQSYVNNAYATMFEVDPETVGQFTGGGPTRTARKFLRAILSRALHILLQKLV